MAKSKKIAGVDEVGRGCLAGPVFAAAVILNNNIDTKGIKDSKKIGDCSTQVIASFHPAFLMRQPDQKKMSWIDLKMIRQKLKELKIKIEK